MSYPPALQAALWSGGITIGILLAVMGGGALAGRLRGKRQPAALSNLLGAGLVMLVPLGVAVPLAALGDAGLRAVEAPPLTYIFISLAGLAGLAGALKANGYGMDGCTKMIGIFAGLYIAVWGIVAFRFAGGLERLEVDAASLAWLKPPLAALPFALLLTRLSNARERTLRRFAGALLILSAFTALCYFPIEAGFAAAWLPASDWLRFPLAGLAVGAALSLVQLLSLIGGSPQIRARRARAMPRQTLAFALIVAPTGLTWALARALVALS